MSSTMTTCNLGKEESKVVLYGHRQLCVWDRNKKVIDMMKDKLGGKTMAQFFVLRAKMYAYRKLNSP